MTTNSPEVIYLIDTGDGVAWCDDPDPTGDGECDDAVKYVRGDAYEALQAEFVIRLDELSARNYELRIGLAEKTSECEKLRKDSERLDWIESQAKKSPTGISFDYHKYVEDGYVLEHGFRFMRRHFASGFKDNIRKAIDAAMQEPSHDNQ